MATEPRRGSILIIACGMAVIIVTLATAMLARIRLDAREVVAVEHYTQARVMLMAACNYILESGRIGAGNEESFGWIDVRDGSMGPKTAIGGTPVFPLPTGSGVLIGRFPMEPWTRPPFAIQPVVAPNPIQASDVAQADFGLPLLKHSDPTPAAGTFSEWAVGDPRRLSQGRLHGWFRLWRDGAATFIVTCGSGASRGFRDWGEIPASDRQAFFADDPQLFAEMRAAERLMWFRVAWNAAIGGVNLPERFEDGWGWKDRRTVANHNPSTNWPDWNNSSIPVQTHVSMANACGTIQWIQRLRQPPTDW